MRTGIVINPHSKPKEGDRLVESLEKQITESLDTEISVYHGAEEIDSLPDNLVLYGGDGSVMMLYNRLLTMTEKTPPILIAGGGSGVYWLHNLGTKDLSQRERIALLEGGEERSLPLIKIEYDGKMTPHDIQYADSFGIGSLADLIHRAEDIKKGWKSSARKSRAARSSLIALSYALAAGQEILNPGQDYSLMQEETRLVSLHGSVLPMAGLGVELYQPDGGIATASVKDGRLAGLRALLQPAWQALGLGKQTSENELVIETKGKVPLHLNGSPFEYEGERIKLTYEPDKLVLIH